MNPSLLLKLPTIKRKIQKFYDASSPYWLKLWGEHIHDGYYLTGKESKQEAQENLIRLLVEKAHIQKDNTVLDVGCGIGGTSIYLANKLDVRTTGITLSPVQVKMARERAAQSHANSSFSVMDAERMDVSKPFDVVWIVGVLTHFINQEQFIKKAAQFLKPGGKFVLGDWMAAERLTPQDRKKYIQPVLRGMLMPHSYSINSYVSWFIKYGYRLTYVEDITIQTTKTWNIGLSIIKNPTLYKLAYQEGAIFTDFLKCIRTMRSAMLKGKLRYGVMVAEKL